MNFRPSDSLTEQQVNSGLKLVVREGLITEAMSTLTGGAFLVAMALQMGASNFQIGLLAALPTFANIFQLTAIWLVQRYKNRRMVSVICAFSARFPLIVIGLLPLLFSGGTSLMVLIFVLFFHYLCNSVVGASWNSWMKDLVPQERLGSYFSHRSRLIQITNVTLSLAVAVVLDYVKSNYPHTEMLAYTVMFLVAGALGMLGVYLLSRTPEPKSIVASDNLFRLTRKPLKDKNFRSLLVFNSFWSFSLNLATPFFSVYMMKEIHLQLSYIIGLNVLSQIASIFFIKIWGKYSDRFSNKTIISICAPLYIFCILAWMSLTMPMMKGVEIPALVVIHVLSGLAIGGINLALSNIGLKLAPKEDAIVYIVAKNMITGFFPALAPLLGGYLADHFFGEHLHFFFLIGGVLAILSLQLLKKVKEDGEVNRMVVVKEMKNTIKLVLVPSIIRRKQKLRA